MHQGVTLMRSAQRLTCLLGTLALFQAMFEREDLDSIIFRMVENLNAAL